MLGRPKAQQTCRILGTPGAMLDSFPQPRRGTVFEVLAVFSCWSKTKANPGAKFSKPNISPAWVVGRLEADKKGFRRHFKLTSLRSSPLTVQVKTHD